jgi:hypothetical protein
MLRRRSVLAGFIAALAVALVLATAGHAATRTCSTFSGAGGDVLRVYALRGVSCAKAVAAAKKFATGDAPAPWHCLTGTGQLYRGKAIAMACGYGSRGPVRQRKHAFVAVQEHTSG